MKRFLLPLAVVFAMAIPTVAQAESNTINFRVGSGTQISANCTFNGSETQVNTTVQATDQVTCTGTGFGQDGSGYLATDCADAGVWPEQWVDYTRVGSFTNQGTRQRTASCFVHDYGNFVGCGHTYTSVGHFNVTAPTGWVWNVGGTGTSGYWTAHTGGSGGRIIYVQVWGRWSC